MMAQLIGAFVILIMAIALFLIVTDQLNNVQSNITSTPSAISDDLNTMLSVVPWIFGAIVLLFVIMMVVRALKSAGVTENDSDYNDDESEDEEDTEEDEDEEEEIEEEDEEEETKPKDKKHSTVVTTRKKLGTKDEEVMKTNVKFGPGYNVDKYALDKPADTKLTMKEDNFKKTRFD